MDSSNIEHRWEQTPIKMPNDDVMPFQPDQRRLASLSAQRIAALRDLLESWRIEDLQEEDTSWQELKQALDEDRLSDRKLFP